MGKTITHAINKFENQLNKKLDKYIGKKITEKLVDKVTEDCIVITDKFLGNLIRK